jgi:hypothetical protein
MIPVTLLLAAAQAMQGSNDLASVSLRLPGRPVYSAGDVVRAEVKVRHDGYLMVLRSGVDGRVTVLFPRRPHDLQQVQAGGDYRFGARGGPWEMVVTARPWMNGPLAERIVVAWSPQPFATSELDRYSFWSTAALRHWRGAPEALLRYLAGTGSVQVVAATIYVTEMRPRSGGRFTADRAYDPRTLAERYPVYIPRRVWDAAPGGGVPPPVCHNGVCSYSVMRLVDLTPF